MPAACGTGCRSDSPLQPPPAACLRCLPRREAGGEVPDWMVAMKRTRAKDRRAAPLAPEVGSGSTISTRPAYDRKQAKRRKQMIDASKAKKAKTLQQPQQ